MKKLFKLALVAVAGSMMISCGGLIDDIEDEIEDKQEQAYDKEYQEISDGKLFEIKAATVEYSNGSVLAFDNYGKEGYLLTQDNVMMLVKDGFTYIANLNEKYYVKTEGGEFEVGASFVFREESFRYMHEHFSGTYYVGLKESKKTVAGKNCVDFVYTVDGKSVEVAGWKRILMFNSSTSDNDVLEATSIKESANIALPDGLSELQY